MLQSPLSSLNPALKIRTQLKEAWRAHASGPKADCEAAIRAALESVSLPATDEFLRKYPSQMSVGQAQRVLIAMAVMHRPALLIADEATSALDVITQSEILALFRELNRSSGMAILYISHDLASVAGICDRIAILHEGQIVETGTTEQVLTNPRHEYTQRLMAAMPKMPQPQRLATGKAAATLASFSALTPAADSFQNSGRNPLRRTEVTFDGESQVRQTVPRPLSRDRVAHPIPTEPRRSPIKTNDLRDLDWPPPCNSRVGYEARSFPHQERRVRFYGAHDRNHRDLRGAENDTAPPGVSA